MAESRNLAGRAGRWSAAHWYLPAWLEWLPGGEPPERERRVPPPAPVD